MEYKHLQVLGNPLELNLPTPILLFSYANYPAGKVNLVVLHVVVHDAVLGDAGDVVANAAHDPRVEKVENSRREGKLTEFESNSSSF